MTEVDPMTQLNDLRERVLAGTPVTAEEYRVLVTRLRVARRAGDLSAGKTKKSKTPSNIDTSSFFDTEV